MPFCNKKIILLLISIPLCSFTVFHKFYVSVTEMEYVQEKQSLQIITRIFVDDFQKELQERYDPEIELGEGGRHTEMVDEYIKKYFGQKFSITIDGKPVTVNFIGKRYEDDLIICYFEAPQLKSFKTIQVVNLVLTDLYEEQKNLVHVKNKGTTKSLLLVKDNPEGSLTFN